ncbi:MAG TPA: AAA family ATPase, partial [Candidatus Deferrimicrobium sp.]|nr:AAA family ATPase [Candidatus Deferrimicrobium sp.]
MDLLLKQKIQKADLEFRKKQFDEEKESREEQKKWLEENTVNLSKVSNILSQNIAQDLKKDITWATETLEKAKIGLQSRLYVIIDEYDNFANQLITSHQDTLYRELTADNSFLKNFFKTLKSGCKDGTIARTFITGVLPITIDDLASGFNIADFITLEPKFENMMGFT